eukprot:COSAG01_NODE_40714_length_460_cov_1.432133_1_plen_32_part_10
MHGRGGGGRGRSRVGGVSQLVVIADEDELLAA